MRKADIRTNRWGRSVTASTNDFQRPRSERPLLSKTAIHPMQTHRAATRLLIYRTTNIRSENANVILVKFQITMRSEKRRVGKASVSTSRSRGSPDNKKKKKR